MFVPLYDDNPLRNLSAPWVTRGLILANVLIYVLFQEPALVGPANAEAVLASFGMIPAVVSGYAYLPPELQRLPEETTLLTYMFLHAGWLHLGTNMLFLWVFGDNVEDAMGHARFLAFYLACGVAAGLVHLASAPDSQVPLVGASGAIAGCVAAYLILHPRVKLWVLVLMRIPLPVPAWLALGLQANPRAACSLACRHRPAYLSGLLLQHWPAGDELSAAMYQQIAKLQQHRLRLIGPQKYPVIHA